MNKVFLLLLLVIGMVDSSAQETKKSAPVTLFTIDGNPTYTSEFIYLYKKNHPNADRDYTAAKVDEYLTLFANFKLKITEAKRRHLDTTAKFIRELKTYHDELKKPYRAEKDVLDKLTHETYDHLKEEVKVAHILIQIAPNATAEDTTRAYNHIKDIRKRAEAGEDFELLATETSEEPNAKNTGGNLGYFTAMQMVYPFEEAAYQTKVGDVSPIVRTRFGYHVLKVTDRRPSKGEVEVSHILLRSTKDTESKVKNKIFEIYDQVKGGRNWDELCKQYSEDANTRNTGGRLRPFGVGTYAFVPEFEATAFAMQNPGDISDPFQTNVGWHIIRLEKKIPLPPYAEVETALKKRVARDERIKISEQGVALKRKRDLGFSENQDTKRKVFALADSNLVKGKWKCRHPELKKLPLISLAGAVIPSGDFISFVEGRHATSKLSPTAFMEQLYQSWADGKVDIAEDEKIVHDHPDFQYLLTEYREGILLFEIMEKEIWNRAAEDTVGQRKFYNNHIAKYSAGNRVEARIFATADKSFLEEIKNKIAKGDTLKDADLKKFKSVQHFRKYEKGDSKTIDRINWVPGMQETQIDGTYYLVDVQRLIAPGTKSLEEAKAKVISDYQDALEKNWVDELRKKFKLSLNNKGKSVVVNELVKK